MGATLSQEEDAKISAIPVDEDDNNNNPFPKWGLRLSHLPEFYQACGGREKLEGLSTHEVRDTFIVPWTQQQEESDGGGLSFCEYLQRQKHPSVAPQANIFVCNAWQDDFLEVMDAVERHLKKGQDNTNNKEPIVWLSLFSCNPHKPCLLDKEWFGAFRLALAEMGRMVLVRSSQSLSNDPLTRTWCLLELYYAATSQPPCSLEITMSSTEQKELLNKVHKNPEEYMNELQAIIDVEHSDSSVKEDKEKILRLFKDTVGYATVNATVLDQHLTCVIQIAKQALHEKSATATLVDQLVLLNTLGELYQKQDNHYMAEYYFGKAMEKTYQQLPPDQQQHQQQHSEESLKIMHNFAKLYYKEEHLAEAKELVAECLAKRTQVLGPSHQDTLSTLNLQANILNGMGEHAAAATLYQDCLTRRTAQLGEDHPDTLISMQNLGAIWLDYHHYDKAQPLLEECMEKQLKLLGRNHPHTQSTMGNLINTYERKANTNALALSPKIC